MSHFLERLLFFTHETESFSNGHGVTTNEARSWEKAYRQRWQHDKVVRSTHGVNCTGSCSWKIYVKKGLITWETQQTDYPRTRADLPNHEPRGCGRGASYSWYIYSASRLKYPLVRSSLIRMWRAAKCANSDPVKAWESLVTDPEKSHVYKALRGKGGFVRAHWDELTELIAASNIYTIKTYGPDRIIGFSPIPAMSMVSYAAGSRYLSLLGGVCMSFYDWYCDLPPSSPQTWGEQTDVPESADWYNSSYLIVWGSNVPQTRTPDAHFYTEVRYKGAKSVVICPDYSEASKLSDLWLAPKQGTDAALAMAMGHVILKEFYLEKSKKSKYFDSYAKKYTDMPFLVVLKQSDNGLVPERMLRVSDFENQLGVESNPEWQTVCFDSNKDTIVVPNGSIGSRWGGSGKWNLELKDIRTGNDIDPLLSLIEGYDDVVEVAFPYFAGHLYKHEHFKNTKHESVICRKLPARKVTLHDGIMYVATVFDLMVANYGIERGFNDEHAASSFEDDIPYTPFWQQQVTGVDKEHVITVAREFAETADKTLGKSMVIIGAAMNHWYHMDMNYRGIINLLVMCGCVGQSGGGWAHYVGQEKLRPQTGWLPLAFGLDWQRPPRHMNSTSFFYNHTNQWRYEQLELDEILSPLADKQRWKNFTLIDCNVKAERMGWLPSAPQLQENPIKLAQAAEVADKSVSDYIVESLKSRKLKFACEDPDNPKNYPRNLFVWRSNLLGSSGKGHEYFLKHLLGTTHGVQSKDLGEIGLKKPEEVVWHEDAPKGKLDLLVTLDFRMSTTCLYSDIVLPTASWYEKDDLNTSDMHPFIHPLSAAIDPVWETKTDWDIYKTIAKKFSEIVPGHLSIEKDTVLLPLLHDTPAELAQPDDVKDWKYGECDPVPGKTMPNIAVVERDYPNIYKRFTALGPLIKKLGNGGKGINWNAENEVDFLAALNRTHDEGITKGMPRIESAIDACEVILSLAPETNGAVAVKAWESLSKITGRDHLHLVISKAHESIRFKDLQAQPRKIITSPIWSGIESEEVCYNAGYTNVHELIPWRTLSGRQQLYQDHAWMRAFGETLCVYKPPIDTKSIEAIIHKHADSKQVVLNFITPHQKWGIHSTYSDNLIMLTLSRGGPIVWISEIDARKIDASDNDWVEAYNINGALVARAVVSQRVPEGMIMMYHAQERIINTPMSPTTKHMGGIHNSVTRATLKPTHMIGGYAQLSYGFNYYGTVGSNRDEFIILRKLEHVKWKIIKTD